MMAALKSSTKRISSSRNEALWIAENFSLALPHLPQLLRLPTRLVPPHPLQRLAALV